MILVELTSMDTSLLRTQEIMLLGSPYRGEYTRENFRCDDTLVAINSSGNTVSSVGYSAYGVQVPIHYYNTQRLSEVRILGLHCLTEPLLYVTSVNL